jgi:hypothetical protein
LAAASPPLWATPVLASDFTPMRVVLFGFYYCLAAGVTVAILAARRALPIRRRWDAAVALALALLFAPSFASWPNEFVATPVIALFVAMSSNYGAQELHWGMVLSVLIVAGLIYGVLRRLAAVRGASGDE